MPTSHAQPSLGSEVSRRSFLCTATAAGTATLASNRLLAAPAKPQVIQLGFSAYAAKTLSLRSVMKSCAGIGYDAIEFALMPGWPARPASLPEAERRELSKLSQSLPLSITALMENLPLVSDDITHRTNLARIEAAAALAHDLSPINPPLLETVLGGAPKEWESTRGKMADRLADWAKRAEAAELVIAIKPHVSGALHNVEGALWLLEQVKSPAIRLAFDYSHLTLRQVPMADAIKRLVPKSSFIHVKDAKGTAESPQFLLPGDGGIDYVEYLRQVASAGYRGSIVVEVSSQLQNRPGYDAIEAARHSYAKLAPAFERAGISRGK